jgi:uncharacterized protein (DUF1778 family)
MALTMYLKVRLSGIQYAMVKAAAANEKMTASEWVRRQIAESAKRAFEDGKR